MAIFSFPKEYHQEQSSHEEHRLDSPSDASSSSSDESSTRRVKTPKKRSSKKTSCTSQQQQQQQQKGGCNNNKMMSHSRYLALDCEMVGTGEYGLDSVLARVTVVNWKGKIVYDEFVRPSQPVVDYRTFVSGITAEQLEQEGEELEKVRSKVRHMIRNKILVGHALKNDLQALGIEHPWQLTRDTAKYEPYMQFRVDGRAFPRKLKDLSSEVLGREIQGYGRPHCPVEDALAAMDLYKAARQKWEQVMDYKIKKTALIVQQQRQEEVMESASVIAVE